MYYISLPARTCLALLLLNVQRTPNYKLTLREAFNLVKLLLETTEHPMRVTHARLCQRQSVSSHVADFHSENNQASMRNQVVDNVVQATTRCRCKKK